MSIKLTASNTQRLKTSSFKAPSNKDAPLKNSRLSKYGHNSP